MKIITRFISVSLLLVLIGSTGFGWGDATHTYYAKQLGVSHGRINLDEMYGAILPDAFNLIMDSKGAYMADQCHRNFMPFVHCAWRCEMKAIAYGFGSHNDTWGADYTAHHNAFTIPGSGYAVAKGSLLARSLVTTLVAILETATPPVPHEAALDLAQALAPALGHDLVETAVDILVKRTQDPDVGSEMLQAAQHRPADVPLQLAMVFAPGLARAVHVSVLEASRFIIGAEREIRNQKLQYGQFLSLPEPQAIEALAAMNAFIAEGFLEAYAGVDVTVDPMDVSGFIGQAIALVQTDYATELSQTLTYLGREMRKQGLRNCGSPFAKEGSGKAEGDGAESFSLAGNYPNPFNPSTTIRFQVPLPAVVSLELYNTIGQKVRTLIDSKPYEPGSWDIVWNGKDDRGLAVPSGVYFSRMTTPNGVFTRKMQLIK